MARAFLQCHHRFKNGKDHCSWSIAEKVRTQHGWVQRHLLYLGEINDSQKEAWTKVTEVFDSEREQTRPLAPYPAERAVPAHAAEYGVQVRLSEFVLRRPRQWGACWVGCQLWAQLKLEEFWRERLADSREGTCWPNVLETLVVYRLVDPGSEWRLHREWFKNSAMADLLAEDFSLAQKDNLYRCLDKLLINVGRPTLNLGLETLDFILPLMDKEQIAQVFNNIALLLELKGENPFKSRAYVNAARAVESLSEPLDKLIAEQRLGEVQGIGESIQKKITELLSTGKLAYYEELKAAIPPGLVLMLEIPGLGPKKIKALHDELGIETIEQLEAACKDGKIAGLKGFGEKTQTNILDGINRRRTYAAKHLVSDAIPIADALLDALRTHPDVIRCSAAGSLRRHREIIGDVDLLASSKKPAAVLDFFASQPGILNVIAKGETKASVLLEGGIQSDLRVVSDAEFPFALMYFTGSKEHNIVMRQRAIDRGLRLNEYGLFRSQTETRDPKLLVRCKTEEEIFEALGLHPIPAEMREDMGEIPLAEKGPLPRLLEWTDLKGSLHNHSTWSDGHQTPTDIANSMRQLGLAYWGVTDHSKASFQANGLDPVRVRQQLKEIKKINESLADEGTQFRLLTGTEVDILRDGKLDFPDDLLAELDVVVASIHQSFSQSEAETTKRLIGVAQNPYVHMLGHLTGRLLLERDAYKVDQRAVIDACAETGTWIELNASPLRFDLDWRLWPYAKSKGVKCVINCDAHRLEHAGYLRLGAGIARKGWLTKDDVINTLPLDKLKKELRRKRER